MRLLQVLVRPGKEARVSRARKITRRMRLPLQSKPLACRVIVFLLFVFSAGAAYGNSPGDKRNSQQVERTVAADPRVVVSACIASGDVTVHGWDRNEVRARISDGV